MKRIFLVFTVLIFALRLSAQTNAPARLALITESADASAAVDVLTAQLSGNNNLQLLERNEIEKVYREQGLSAGSKDYLKLGQILGADGLLLLETAKEGTNQFLNVRLVAVKPGVALVAEKFSWPVANLTEWSAVFANHLNPLLPKLTVLVKDAIPISVVNLRSAISSTDAAETERQLKLLTIQRLSREPQFFVLERQKMQLLAEEKDLKLDDSAFWNGSYLLEGVVDQNGYSKDTVTINARLTPPRGGAPVLIEVKGSRKNFAEVINQMALKVNEVLKVSATIKEWNPADEGQQYFDEAKWAMGWGVLPEAQAAADSAWALGKRDLDCALVRVRAYLKEVPLGLGKFQGGLMMFTPGTESGEKSQMKDISDQYVAVVFDKKGRQTNYMDGKINYIVDEIGYIGLDRPPDSQSIDHALHALKLYEECNLVLSNVSAKAGTNSSNWQSSDWSQLGLNDLMFAAQILQQFNLIPNAQKPVVEKLADLRAASRSVTRLISIDFVSRVNVYDSGYLMPGNLLSCKVDWGCFWQERPEDCITMYHDLMGSLNFVDLQGGLLSRPLQSPRLVAWSEEDRKRIPVVWGNFVQELNASTNIDFQILGKAFMFRNGHGDEDAAAGWAALETERQKLEDERQKLATELQKELQKTEAENMKLQAFERQKQYLNENKPFDPLEFNQLFISGFKDYSKAQALQLQALLSAFKTNSSEIGGGHFTINNLSGTRAQIRVLQIDQVEANVNRILNPPPPPPQPTPQAPKPVTTIPVATVTTEVVTNIIKVGKFAAIPMDSLTRLSSHERIETSRVDLEAHHWFEEKLLLDFSYYIYINVFDDNGVHVDNRVATGDAIAMFDLATEHWKIIEVDSKNTFNSRELSSAIDPSTSIFYHRSVLLADKLFNCDGRQIKRYDFQEQQWQVLPVSDGNNYELFAIDGHLYAANGEIIFEILDGWKSTRILASARRNPPVSTLDRENLGTPTLFEGLNHSLRVCTSSKIFTWTGNDWHEDSGTPPASSQAEIFRDGLLFRRVGFLSAGYQNGVIFRQADGVYGILNSQDEFFCLENEANAAKLCLKGDQGDWHNLSAQGRNVVQPPKSYWEMPANLLPNLPAALRQSDLYVLEDNFAVHAMVNSRHQILQEKTGEKNDYNAALLCFFHDFPLPQKVFLKFDAPDSKTPTWMFPTTNLFLFGNSTGVWIVPVSQLDSAIAFQKQIQLAHQAKMVVASEQVRKSLLAKYDLNQNNIIDADEKETALDDPAFLESELDAIDANHNGILEAAELIYFDANKNKILEPKEQAGIGIAQHLLADKLLKKFDANGDGWLDRAEFKDVPQASTEVNRQPTSGVSSYPDENRDGHIDLGELETFLNQETRRGLRTRRMPLPVSVSQMNLGANQPVDQRQIFKAVVESYWQNLGSITNQPPRNNMIPGEGLVPNRPPPGAAQ